MNMVAVLLSVRFESAATCICGQHYRILYEDHSWSGISYTKCIERLVER